MSPRLYSPEWTECGASSIRIGESTEIIYNYDGDSHDRALAIAPEPVGLRRRCSVNPNSFVDVACKAFGREYKRQELIGGTSQMDIHVILSPTGIERAQ